MDRHMPDKDRKEMSNVPSLVDLCVQTAIDNVRYLGDVGGVGEQLLERILPHCDVDQLKHIEDCSEGTDLSPLTDYLWKNFYHKKFGERSFNTVVQKMKSRNVTFQWRKLYEAKVKDMEEAQQKSIERMKKLYQNEDAQKKSRQVKLCTKVPPSSNKRNFYGGWGPGSIVGSSKSNLMKKSKVDFLKSQEVRNLTALRKNVVQKDDRPLCIRKPGGFSSKGSASTSQNIKPFQRR
ncbi:uncharacterized protein LOC108215582 isoform X2 [Daucus carota subsp. sativus]|uniref:Elongin-A n=3 Tax=Daucus carota subsp. sativus TaxID=79200 RepID=A0A165YX49_DAUCS|nr:PREDICTED: transcription elongation factor B polypeptide 3-like [Daucus carota subsp. sativus]XP_017243573.1 PREDICTED: transcription elongation factor B polypeptide 3-like [Daucus carota subsp. sativus]